MFYSYFQWKTLIPLYSFGIGSENSNKKNKKIKDENETKFIIIFNTSVKIINWFI